MPILSSCMKQCLLLVLFAITHQLSGQNLPSNFSIQPFFQFQLWGSHSTDFQQYNVEDQRYEDVGNRWNTMIRRGRTGVKGVAYDRIKYQISLAYDFIGRDIRSSVVGGVNPTNPRLFIWTAYAQYQMKEESEGLYLTAGFFTPQLGRESITSAFDVTSLEKTIAQRYIRRHLVGSGPGKAVGLNLGGLVKGDRKVYAEYNLGLFNPLNSELRTTNTFGNSSGFQSSPLIVGRGVLYLGDPELIQYKLSRSANSYGKRYGISIALGGSYQGETDLYDESTDLGVDILWNQGNWNLDGEWHWMSRSGDRVLNNGTNRMFTGNFQIGYIRTSYNFLLSNSQIIEPAISWSQFKGPDEFEEQLDAMSVGSFAGEETSYDIGLNWYIKGRNLKFALHYTFGEGDTGAMGDGATVNEYFNQPGLGAIKRGNWLGWGMNVLL